MTRKIIMPAVMLLLFTFILIPSGAFATTYYVDAISGSDSNSGTSVDTPWQTVAKVNAATFSAGDYILFKKGDTWSEMLTPPSDGAAGSPITFGAYGTGAQPTFSGIDLFNNSNYWFTYPYSGNLVSNGDFETWSNGLPSTWTANNAGAFSQSTSEFHSGSSALVMAVDSLNTDVYIYKNSSAFVANAPYIFSIWYNIPSGKSAKLTLSVGSRYLKSDATWQGTSQAIYLAGTGAWAQYTLSFTTEGTASVLRVVIERNSAASSNLYFDDVQLNRNETADQNVWGISTTDNTGVLFNGTAGTNQVSTTTLVSDGDWYSDGSILWVYSSTGANPATVWTNPGIEAGTRRNAGVKNNHSYVTFDGLHVTKAVLGFRMGSDVPATQDVSIVNCTSDNNSQQGIMLGNGTGHVNTNYYINNNIISNNGTTSSSPGVCLYHGIYFSHTSSSTASNNTFSGQLGGFSIQVQDASNNNLIENNISTSGTVGGTCGFLTIYNNGDGLPTGNKIFNNISSNYEGWTVFVGGATISSMNYIFNNVFIQFPNTSGDGLGNYGINIANSGTTGLASTTLFNNIVRNSSVAGTYSHTIYDARKTLVSDYNNFGPERSSFIWTGQNNTTLSSYTATTNNDAHSTSSDPTLVSDTDFHLFSLSNGIDAGIATTSRTTDLAGNPIYGTPDIGAYEYQPPFTLGTDKIDPTGSIRIYGDRKYRYTTATSSTMSADFSVSPAEGSWTYSASSSRPEWLNISNITWDTSGDYSKSWTASSSNATTTVFTIGDLRPNTKYDVSVDGSVSSSPTSDSSGKISYTYTGGYSTHTFSVSPSAVVESQSVQMSQSVSSSGGSGFSPAARLAYLAKIYADNGLTYNPGNNAPNDTVSIANTEVNVKATFSRTLKPRASGNDVKALQVFLNNHGFVVAESGPGSPGNETDFFGRATWNALIKFQNHYADEILKPIGLKYGSGILGPMTLNMIIELSGKR